MSNVLADQRNSGYLRIYYDYVPDYDALTINEAVGLLREERYAEALPLLRGVSEASRAWNALGVALYMTNNYFYNLMEATVTTILLYPFFYLPGAQATMLIVIGAFLAFAFVIRFVRGVKVFLTLKNSSCFYLFYYLCIVEITPILVVIKWFIAQ